MATPNLTGLTPKMAGQTPKMTGSTPSALGTFGFSPALLGQSPMAMLKHSRSPLPSGTSPGMLVRLGMTPGMGMQQLPPDETKKRELEEMLKLLAQRPGRISIPAIERLAKGMGLDFYKEDGDAPGVIRLSLAAKIFLLDIEYSGNTIIKAQLALSGNDPQTFQSIDEATKILQNNLVPVAKTPGRYPLFSSSIGDFSENLTRLYRTDKLSTENLNCFTAISGIYQSLEKIYHYERENMGEMAALCFGNGRPQMHIRGKVGLSIDYWKERRILNAHGGENSTEDEEERLWRVLIEVEEAPNFGGIPMNHVTPVRSTNHWVSDEIKKHKEDNLFGDLEELTTDWLEPPLEELMEITGDPTQSKPPSARFVARLDPPLVLPWPEEQALNPSIIPTDIDSFERLLFPSLSPKESTYREVYSSSEDVEPTVHNYHLETLALKTVSSRRVTDIPFSHPRDLLRFFHTLRQYALLSTLLESCFSPKHVSKTPPSDGQKPVVMDELDLLLQGFDSSNTPAVGLPVTISLEPEQGFGLRVVYPDQGGMGNWQVVVGRNGDLKVATGGNSATEDRIRKALGAAEDLGLVVEWVRRGMP
ncbi:mediator of RNA polymerase II transcription subunit 1-domain-containing protein [Pyronema omphalodes]|nr:mediator of RNA polymerase II transcription subunit 1-domain-containing protein [Pyronema omphalodes]